MMIPSAELVPMMTSTSLLKSPDSRVSIGSRGMKGWEERVESSMTGIQTKGKTKSEEKRRDSSTKSWAGFDLKHSKGLGLLLQPRFSARVW